MRRFLTSAAGHALHRVTPGHALASGPRLFIFQFSLSAGPALPPTAQVICSFRARDPSGTPTLTGTANQWPFLYHGMEQEGVDEFPHYYYTGNGQFYNTQMVRSLSEVGETGSQGTCGGPAGNAIALPSGGGNGSFGHWYVNNVLDPSSTGNQLGNLPDIGFSTESASYVIPLGEIARIIEEWVSFFEWLFGGGGTPVIPRQLLHNRHPLYTYMLGVSDDLISDEVSAAQGRSASNRPPLATNPPGSANADPPGQTNDVGKFIRLFARVVHPLDVIAANGAALVTGGILVGAGYLAIAAGCLDPTPVEPVTCAAAIGAGGFTIGLGATIVAAAAYGFARGTLPEVKKSVGCHK